MKISPFALLLVASVAAAQKKPVAPPPSLLGRLPGSVLKPVDSLVMDAKTAKLESPLNAFIGPNGKLIINSQWATVTAFDSLGRKIWRQAPQERKEIDVATVMAVGSLKNEMWVSDAAYGQIAFLDNYGNVTKSVEVPSFIRPTFSNRKAFPVFASMRIYALLEDGSMIVEPRSPHEVAGATTYDSKSTYLVRASEDGIIQKTIARIPATSVVLENRPNARVTLNSVRRGLFAVAGDGMRTATAVVDTTSPTVDSVVVREFNDKGDTVFKVVMLLPAAQFTQQQVDSIARSAWGSSPDRERRAALIPRRIPAVYDLALGPDRVVWLTMRGNGVTRPVVAIDGAGKVLGKFELAPHRAVKAADVKRLWVGPENGMAGDLVRYTFWK